jgi:FixJ family two-component response regulator
LPSQAAILQPLAFVRKPFAISSLLEAIRSAQALRTKPQENTPRQ